MSVGSWFPEPSHAPRALLSVRAKLALSYAAVVVVTGGVLLSVVAVFLLRYISEEPLTRTESNGSQAWVPNRGDIMRTFVPAASWAMLALLLAGLVGGWILAGVALRPLSTISAAAQKAAEGSLSHRIELTGPRDEFRRLADVFDVMLARVEKQVDDQRRFAANASHELRTPITVSQALLEVARADPDPDMDFLIDELSRTNRRAGETIEALLALSRADAGTFTVEAVDLSLLAEETVESSSLLNGLDVTVTAEPALARGSEALLRRLTVNLITNAGVHNREGGHVTVRTGVDPSGSAVIEVENSGDLVDPAILPTLVAPFQRGAGRTRSVGTAHVGAGLGLAIVHAVTEAHGGLVTLEALAGGGLVVRVVLPAVPTRD